MGAEEYFDMEWELDSNDDLPDQSKEVRSRRLDKNKQQADWEESEEVQKRGKNKMRWRDIEDRQDRLRLRRCTSWDYDDYYF